MIDLSRIHIGDEVIIRLPSGQKVLGEVESDGDFMFVKNPDGDPIYFAVRMNDEWRWPSATVIGHIPSMFGGDW